MGRRERFKKYMYDPFYIRRMDSIEHRQMMLSPSHLSHLASIYTKLSLSHNVIMRDPTIDKRVIEFCLSVPDEQYIINGKERYLIRRAMKGILPDKVRLNDKERGQQSADFIQRLGPLEQEIKEEIRRIGQSNQEIKYLDIDRIQKKLNDVNIMKGHNVHDYDIRMLLRSIIFSRYLRLEKIED